MKLYFASCKYNMIERFLKYSQIAREVYHEGITNAGDDNENRGSQEEAWNEPD